MAAGFPIISETGAAGQPRGVLQPGGLQAGGRLWLSRRTAQPPYGPNPRTILPWR
jgi:hypothetical protein